MAVFFLLSLRERILWTLVRWLLQSVILEEKYVDIVLFASSNTYIVIEYYSYLIQKNFIKRVIWNIFFHSLLTLFSGRNWNSAVHESNLFIFAIYRYVIIFISIIISAPTV